MHISIYVYYIRNVRLGILLSFGRQTSPNEGFNRADVWKAALGVHLSTVSLEQNDLELALA